MQSSAGNTRFLVDAVIWDMDGVIVDTDVYHREAWIATFSRRGIDLTQDDVMATVGRRNDDIVRRMIGKEASRKILDEIGGEKEADYRRRASGKITALPGVVDLLTQLERSGLKQAVVTSAPLANVRLVMESLELEQYFNCIVSEKDVKQGKPSPEGFLKAAQRMGVPAANCLVIEDAAVGVSAALNAGMSCIAVTTTHSECSLSHANLVVESLEDVAANQIRNLQGIR